MLAQRSVLLEERVTILPSKNDEHFLDKLKNITNLIRIIFIMSVKMEILVL